MVRKPPILQGGGHISRVCRVQAQHASLVRSDPLFATCMRNYERQLPGDHTGCATVRADMVHTADDTTTLTGWGRRMSGGGTRGRAADRSPRRLLARPTQDVSTGLRGPTR